MRYISCANTRISPACAGIAAERHKPPIAISGGFFAFAGLRDTYTGLVPLGAAPAPYHAPFIAEAVSERRGKAALYLPRIHQTRYQ